METSFKLGEVNSFPYALSREQIEAINSFTKLLDEDGVTNQIFNWIYDYNIPVSTTQEPPTVPPSPRPIHEDAIHFYMQYFNLENRFKFGENWASTFYKRQYRRHIWPACFPLIDSEYPTRDPNKANGLTVGWEDVGPSFEQDERRNYLHENRVVYFEEVYSGKSRVRESLIEIISKPLRLSICLLPSFFSTCAFIVFNYHWKLFLLKLLLVHWQQWTIVRILSGWGVTLTTRKEPSATGIPPQVFFSF